MRSNSFPSFPRFLLREIAPRLIIDRRARLAQKALASSKACLHAQNEFFSKLLVSQFPHCDGKCRFVALVEQTNQSRPFKLVGTFS
jgi:hypothetical protein